MSNICHDCGAPDDFEETIDTLRAERDKAEAHELELREIHKDDRAEIARLRAALEWFADANNYEESTEGDPSEVACEGVRRARAALGGENKDG